MAAHRDKQVVLMQYFVVLQIVQKGIGHIAHFSGQKDCGAFHTCWGRHKNGIQEINQAEGVGFQGVVEQPAAIVPSEHEQENTAANDQGEPAAFKQFKQIGGPKSEVNHKEEAGGANAKGQWQVPAVANHVEGEYGGDQHVGTHSNAVGGCQIARGFEQGHGQHDQHKQAPIDEGNVNLAELFDAGVQDL